MHYSRIFDAHALLQRKSFFLFGPRSVGKTTLLEDQLPEMERIDLLDSDDLVKYGATPKRLLDLDLKPGACVVVDEIQKSPALLDAVQMAIQKKQWRFVLTGSSARKLKRQGVNLLGGRAWEAHLLPLCWKELTDFDLTRYLNRGGLPHVYLSDSWREDLRAYISLYMKEEIIQEAATRDVPGFSRFLERVGVISGEELVVEKLAAEASVKASTVRNYLDILKDTLLTFEVLPFHSSGKRKAISRSKLWLFDVGVANLLSGRNILEGASDDYGRAFEHFIGREIATYLSYSRSQRSLHYWRTMDQKEVDFVVPGSFACEVKATRNVTDRSLSGLLAFMEERAVPRYFVVSREERPRKVGHIEIWPWELFLKALWGGELVK